MVKLIFVIPIETIGFKIFYNSKNHLTNLVQNNEVKIMLIHKSLQRVKKI